MLVVPILSEALAVIDHQVLCWHLAGPRLVFQIGSTARRPCCPRCHNSRVRRHGHYQRHPSDLPSFGTPVTLDVEVRRWRCMAPGCGGHTFSDSMGSFVQPRSRYSVRSRVALEHLGCNSGGQAGARLSWALGLRAGADTILRAVHALPLPAIGEPVVVGIDDWALARGHHYGTIFVDLQQHRPLDLIAGREMTEVRNWLTQHPGIRVVARDRAGAYGQATRQALPQAVQLTDRGHLLNNLSEMAERALLGCQQALRTATAKVNAEPWRPNVVTAAPAQAPSTAGLQSMAATRQEQRRALRLDRFEEVRRRHGQAQAVRSTARNMGLSANTIRKFVRADGLLQRSREKAASAVSTNVTAVSRACSSPTSFRSYAAANRGLGLDLEHRQHKGLNNRVTKSHQPTRVTEKVMRRFKSARHLQRFASTHDQVANLFMHGRYNRDASAKRAARTQAFAAWVRAIGARTFGVTAM